MLKQVELPFETGFERLLTVDEIWGNTTSHLLKILKEDRRIERKPAGIHANVVGEYLNMWSNTAPDGGLLAVGISDKGGLEGILSSSVNHINDLERAGDAHCIDVRYETKRIPFIENGKRDEILLFRVPYNNKKLVRMPDGRVFARRGESKREIKGDEIRELQIDKGEIAWEQEDSDSKYPDDFHTERISSFATAVVQRRNLSADKTNEDILVLRRLGRVHKGNFIPNKACALLFCKDPCREIPGCKVRFLRFDGVIEGQGEKWNAIKDAFLEGTIPELIVQSEKVLEAQLREFSKLGKDGTFYTAVEYPKVAWYEAVVNACCHRSYSLKNSVIFIKMFDDRLEIESPGGFMPFVNSENIYEQHHPRNPQVMEALFYLDYVKCAHEGTRRMKQTMIDGDLPEPVFRQKQASYSSVRVTLRNNIEHRKVWVDTDAVQVVGAILARTLTPHEKRAVNFVAEFKAISVSQVQRLTSLSWPASKTLLEKLVKKGILVHIKRKNLDRDPQARYQLRPQSDPN